MKIEKIQKNQLKISLSCTEMLQMNPQLYPELTSHLVTNVMQEMEQEDSFSILNHTLILEFIPKEEDGCEIYITANQPASKRCRSKNQPLIIAFLEKETLLYAVSLIESDRLKELYLYQLDEKYYLVLYQLSKDYEHKIALLLSDYGQIAEQPLLYESILKEYAIPLRYGNISPQLQKPK